MKTAPQESSTQEIMESAVSKLGAMAFPDEEDAQPGVEETPEADEAAEQTPDEEAVDAAADEEAEVEEEESGEKHGKKPMFSPEQQRIFEGRIGKEVAKREELKSKVAELEAKLAEREGAADEATVEILKAAEIAPEYLPQGGAKVLQQDAEFANFEAWALEHWDEDEVQVGEKTYTKNEVRRRYGEVRRQHDQIAGRAQAIREQAREQMLADLREGRKARLARAAVKNVAGKKPGGKPSGMVPVAAAPGRPQKPIENGPSAKRFQESGRTKEAAARELARLAGD